VVKEQDIVTNYMRKQEIPFMHLTKNELKSLIKEALSAQINEISSADDEALAKALYNIVDPGRDKRRRREKQAVDDWHRDVNAMIAKSEANIRAEVEAEKKAAAAEKAPVAAAATATTDPLGGGLLGAGAAAAGDESANAIQNLFLTAFGLAPQQTAPATPPQTASQKGQDGESWVGKSWRDVMGALKSEFNIRGSKGWYKKLPYNHDARVKYREWYTSRGK